VVRLEPAKRTERAARLQKVGDEAARQCGRGDVPRVLIAGSLDEALGAAPADAARFTLYEGATRPLRDLLPAEGPLAFFVGPEGGLEPGEVSLAESLGFESVSLGAFVLRTETVPAAVLGAIRILRM
jgi:16S rRNA (uracil1498-N3)-methyltransferase